MQRLRLQRDIHHNHGPTGLWPRDMGTSTQGDGTFGNRAWGKGRGLRGRCPVVRDAQTEMLVATTQRHGRLRAVARLRDLL